MTNTHLAVGRDGEDIGCYLRYGGRNRLQRHATLLPDAKPDEVGFSQGGLGWVEDFFAREIAAKRVPGAVNPRSQW